MECSSPRRPFVRNLGDCQCGAKERRVTEMTMLDWQTFVPQRRINRPSQEVLHAISTPAVFGSGAVLSPDAGGALRLEEPSRRVARLATPVGRANARLNRKN